MKITSIFAATTIASTACSFALSDTATNSPAETSSSGSSESELAKASQNPLGSLISLPFENNFFFGAGPSESTGYALIAKPVYPVNFGSINLINRGIIPFMATEGQDLDDLAAVAGLSEFEVGFTSGASVLDGSATGLGDITYQGLFTPAEPGKWILGIGPALTFPTHTDERFGTDKWSGGVAAVALTMPGKWVVGGLVQQTWSYAGPESASDVNKATFQYFINYNFSDGWYLSSSPIMTANWEQSSGDRWTVPVGGGIGKMHKFGNLPVDFKLASYYNVERPEYGPEWQAQFTIKFLFPK